MSFQIIPFFDEDELVGLDPWRYFHQRPSQQSAMVPRMSQLLRDVDRLKRTSLNDGIVPRNDAFEVALDVHGFDPKELQVSVNDNFLTMSGRHEEKSPDGSSFVSRSFTRKYHLPQNVNQEALKSALTNDGKTLRVEAPLVKPNQPEAKAIPIEVQRGNPAVENGPKK